MSQSSKPLIPRLRCLATLLQQLNAQTACDAVNEAIESIESTEAIRQSQSLPAGAVAGNRFSCHCLGACKQVRFGIDHASPTIRLQQKCVDWGAYWRASDAHGVILSADQALELLRDALGVEVEIEANEVKPAQEGDWHTSEQGSHVVDFDQDPANQLSILLKRDGTVSAVATKNGNDTCGGYGLDEVANVIRSYALQADAREKGEAFAGYVGDNGEFFWPDLPQGRIDKLRSEGVIVREVFYATQPAQASEAPICHAEYLSRTPQPVTPAGGEVAVYQRRTRPTFDPKHLWTPWEDCSEASFNDVKRAPVVLDWISESRALYEHPPVADAALVRTLEHCRDWFESQAKVISKGCGSSWNIVQCHEQRDLIDEVLAALNQRGGGSHA